MRVTKDQKEETRKKILAAAGKGFRAQGYGSLGVDGLAKDAGVTSGAFYSHFSGKNDAFLHAVKQCLQDGRLGGEALMQNEKDHWASLFLDHYLGEQHRADLPNGCAIAGLSADVARAGTDVKEAYQQELLKVIDTFAAGLAVEKEPPSRDKAWRLMSLLVGSLLMARAVKDPKIAEEITSAVKPAAKELANI